MMITPVSRSALPDPHRHAEFYADVPMKRLVAWIVDTVLIAVIVLAVLLLTAFTFVFLLPLVIVVVSFVYRYVTLARGSATPGMRLMAIEFLDHRGDRFGPGTAFFHTLGYVLSVAFVLPQIASIALMLTTERRQGLSDLVLGTVAVNRAARH